VNEYVNEYVNVVAPWEPRSVSRRSIVQRRTPARVVLCGFCLLSRNGLTSHKATYGKLIKNSPSRVTLAVWVRDRRFSPYQPCKKAAPFTQNICRMLEGEFSMSLPRRSIKRRRAAFMRMRSSSSRCSTAGAAHLLIATRWRLGGVFIIYTFCGALGDHALPWRLHSNWCLYSLLYGYFILGGLHEPQDINFTMSTR